MLGSSFGKLGLLLDRGWLGPPPYSPFSALRVVRDLHAEMDVMTKLAIHTDRPRLQRIQNQILSVLSPGEAEEWRTAVARAEAEGTFFIAEPFHCAVGTKPE